MSMTKAQESYSAYRMPQKDRISDEFRYLSRSITLSPIASDEDNRRPLNRVAGPFALDGTDISREELTELQIFDEYLAGHVQQNGICTVQCMLLWSEWVRTFRRKTHGFPKLIREQEFNKVIQDRYGVVVGDEGFRGRVFEGLQFIS
jgi:hypothetical protein